MKKKKNSIKDDRTTQIYTPLPTREGLGGRLFSPYLWYLPIIVVLAIAGATLVQLEGEFLWRAQELNLWLPTENYWNAMAQYPGAGVSRLACYLTQFFYHPWLGTTILCVLWFIICILISAIYKLRGPWVLISLLVPAALLAAFTQTGYWLYYLKLQGHLFVPTLGVLAALISLGIYRLLPNIWLRLVWMAIWTVLGYRQIGAWGLAGTALMAFPESLDEITKPLKDLNLKNRYWIIVKPFMVFLFAVLLIFLVPQAFYKWYFEMTNHEYIYVAGLPSFRGSKLFDVVVNGEKKTMMRTVLFKEYWTPYYGIIVSFVICYLIQIGKALVDRLHNIFALLICIFIVASSAFFVKLHWYRDANFEKELAMYHATEECDWEKVLQLAREATNTKPTRQIVLYRNLALFRLGRAGNEMFTYPEGAERQNAPWLVRMTQLGGKQIYYHYGKANFCYRWCMEDGVEFGWKAETLKLMARTSLLNHEWEAARKYLNLLKKTTFHREWAERYEKLLDTPEAFDLEKAEDAKAAGKPLMSEGFSKEFLPIMHLMTYPDRLDSDNSFIEMYLLQTFANGYGTDPVFQEATLNCALIMKDIQLFWPRFMQFATMHPDIHMPTHYQEAAYLYGHLEDKVDISHMPFDQDVRDSYDKFMKFNEQCGRMSEEEKAKAFKPQFGNTFYYFYFLVRGQKTN